MSLASFSIKKPVTMTMIYLAVCLLGFISLFRLPQEFFPPITYPQLSVITNYQNAAPEEIETLITKLIEEAVGTVKNARRVVSISREGTSIVTVEFNWGTDMNFAALGMREKIDLIKERLPRDAEEPLVMKFNPFALPIMTLSVSGDRPLNELYEIARQYLKDKLEKIEGVASCSISGGIEREIQVNVSEGALQAADISLIEIVNALGSSNLNYPAGTTEEVFFEWLIRTMGEFTAISDIDATVITLDEDEKNGTDKREDESALKRRRTIKLGDIAAIKDGFKEKTSYSRYNGKENVSVAIQRQAEANTIQTVQKVFKELKKIEEILPDRVSVDVVYDQSKFIKSAIGSVTDAAWQGGILAILVLLLFLQNVKHSLIVGVTIPISIIGTFCLMYFSGISINMISFLGLAMGVGMLVDGAIVVVENIFRHCELGEDLKTASEKGTDEMTAAVTSSVLTTVAVFLPLIFVVGVTGQMFKDLSLTITYSLMVSLIVAFTLIPMLVVTGKPTQKSTMKIAITIDSWLKKMASFYARVLKVFLANRKKGLMVVCLMFLGSLVLFSFIGKEFMPKVDEGQFMIKVDMPAGTRLDVTNEVAKRVEQVILGMKYVKTVSATVGANKEESSSSGNVEMLQSNQSQIAVSLDRKRKVGTDKFIQDLKGKLDSTDTEGADISYVLSQSVIFSAFQEGGDAPIVVEIKGTDLAKLEGISKSIMASIRKIKGVYNIKSNMKEPAPETKIMVNRDKAALYSLSVQDIARTAQIAIDGWVATKYKEEGKEIDVRVRLREADRKDFSAIRQLKVISSSGTEVSLNEVTDLKLGKGPSEIQRMDKERTILVQAGIFNRNNSEVIKEVLTAISTVAIPSGYPKPKLVGEQEQMKESFNSLLFALILSILLVYMIMASQFESLWQPFIIMFTVPLSVIGVALALLVTGTTVNVVSIFGFIVLGGIVVDNGIVLLDCVNTFRADGKSLYDAVVEASATRLRPILMTALATIVGLIPLALGIGEGAELQSPLAITCIGGLAVATFLTLVVIPAVYLMSEEFFEKRRQIKK